MRCMRSQTNDADEWYLGLLYNTLGSLFVTALTFFFEFCGCER
jgi:hypothetical protein